MLAQKRNFAVIEQIGQSVMIVCYTISPDTKKDILQQDYIKLDQTCINPNENGYSVSFTSQGDIDVVENPQIQTTKDGCYLAGGEKRILIKLVDPSKELSTSQLQDPSYIGRSDQFHFWNLGFNTKNINISLDCSGVDFKILDVSQFRPMIMTIYL